MPTPNVRQLMDGDLPVYPITDKSLVIGLQDAPFSYYIVAWDGASTPVVANIPAGVVVNYNSTDYTGTLAANSTTAQYLYLVASTTQQGEYDRYIVTLSGSSLVWQAVGSTAIVSPVIADDLVTNDSSKALSAKQGKILNDNVSQLELKVDGFMWQDKSSEIGTLTTYKIVAAHNANEGTTIYSASEFLCTDYIPVTGGSTIRVSVAGLASTGNAGISFYDSTKAVLANQSICYQNEGTANNDLREITIPSGASYFRTTINAAVGTTVRYYLFIQGESYEDRISALESEVEEIEGKLDNSGNLSLSEQLDIMSKFHDIRYVDIMPQTGNSAAPATKIGMFTPVSATATTITLSAEDAACIDKQLALVCHTTGDKYYICQFSAATSNTITLLYDYGVEIDLTTVDNMMALHDTINGGYGQHLSPWGYKAVGEIISEQSKSVHWMSNKVASGMLFINASTEHTTGADPIVRTSDNAVLCTPTINELWQTSGRIGGSGSPYAGSGVASLSDRRNGWWDTKRYQITQGVAGAKMQFKMPSFNRPVKGFVKVLCAAPINGEFDGTAALNFYNESGTLLGTKQMPSFADVVILDITTPISELTVEVEILENKFTLVYLGAMVLYENYSTAINPIDSTSIVAIMGSSNTQYPPSNAAYIGLVSGDPFNTVVVRPDGTSGDGYGYYPKELAKVSGATVDNWGKSGEKTTYGLSTIHGVFDNKRYSHAILSYFANDLNAGNTTFAAIVKRIWEMCEFAKGHGATPVIVMSYGTASSGQTVSYGKLHDYLMMGVHYQHIAE